MLEIKTKRLVGVSDMKIVDRKLQPTKSESDDIDIFNLQPSSGKESSFIFYDINNVDTLICHIGITWQRNRFEVSYGTEEAYQEKGFLQEALSGFLKWIISNTDEKEIWGLPNGPESEHILVKCGFKYYNQYENGDMKWYRFDSATEA